MNEPTVQRLMDLDGNEDGRTSIVYHEAVDLSFDVDRDSKLRRRGQEAPFVAKVGWGSRSGLTLDEAESMAHALMDGVRRAREDLERRNGTSATPRPRQ